MDRVSRVEQRQAIKVGVFRLVYQINCHDYAYHFGFNLYVYSNGT